MLAIHAKLKINSMLNKNILIILILLILPQQSNSESIETADNLFNQGKKAFLEKDYYYTEEYFSELINLYPYYKKTNYAYAALAYSLYYDEYYDDAIKTIDRFFRLHPIDENENFMRYIKILCFMNKSKGYNYNLDNLKKAKKEVLLLINKQTDDDKFIKASKEMLKTINNNLASNIITRINKYIKSKYYAAIVIELNKIIYYYSDTIYGNDAIQKLITLYYNIGLKDFAITIRKQYSKLYPKYKFIEETKFLLDKK